MSQTFVLSLILNTAEDGRELVQSHEPLIVHVKFDFAPNTVFFSKESKTPAHKPIQKRIEVANDWFHMRLLHKTLLQSIETMTKRRAEQLDFYPYNVLGGRNPEGTFR